MAETVFVLCDNGSVIEHDLPLPSGIAARVESGQLRLVDDPKSEPSGDEVPDGTAAFVLVWVGDDPDRAARALEAEQAKGDAGRSGLMSALGKLTGG